MLAWLTDPMDLQFLQIQGSGRVQLDNGRQLRIGYADQNGHPYKPIGRWLVEQGELKKEDVTMGTIHAWAMGFLQTPVHFVSLRFLLGIAEAGFFPGVLDPAGGGIPDSR